MKVYPMFTEISLHLGNIQTLINQNKILYSSRELSSFDDELLISDLKLKDIPVLAEDEFEEYRKISTYTLPKLEYYFGIAKSIWVIVYDSIKVTVKKNKDNLSSKTGFFYYTSKDDLYVWKYSTRKVKNSETQTKTSIKLIYKEPISDLTIQEIVSNFLKLQNKPKTICAIDASTNSLAFAFYTYKKLTHYGNEQIVEAFYKLSIANLIWLTLDYQYVINPAYNKDRGPVSIFGLRGHVEF